MKIFELWEYEILYFKKTNAFQNEIRAEFLAVFPNYKTELATVVFRPQLGGGGLKSAFSLIFPKTRAFFSSLFWIQKVGVETKSRQFCFIVWKELSKLS